MYVRKSGMSRGAQAACHRSDPRLDMRLGSQIAGTDRIGKVCSAWLELYRALVADGAAPPQYLEWVAELAVT